MMTGPILFISPSSEDDLGDATADELSFTISVNVGSQNGASNLC